MTHPFIRPQPGILDIAPYKQGEASIAGHAQVLKLSANENPHGPSGNAVAAFRAAADGLAIYPDGAHVALRAAIAEVHGLDPLRIICGNGSGEILSLLALVYAGPGTEVVHPEHGFSMYPIYAHAAGATPIAAPETNRTIDVDAILAACGERTRLVLIGNPGNPTGTMIPASEVARLAARLPPHALLVLDGAYAEYVEGFDGGASLVEARDNVVMTRTFSKIHGLGGLRVGWGYGPDHVIDALNRVRGPFNLSGPALAAAEAAIRDTTWTDICRARNAADRASLAAGLAELGIASDPSHANFILARFRDGTEADAADAALRAAGIIVRKVGGYGFPEALRITVGDAAACARVTDTLAAFTRVRA